MGSNLQRLEEIEEQQEEAIFGDEAQGRMGIPAQGRDQEEEIAQEEGGGGGDSATRMEHQQLTAHLLSLGLVASQTISTTSLSLFEAVSLFPGHSWSGQEVANIKEEATVRVGTQWLAGDSELKGHMTANMGGLDFKSYIPSILEGIKAAYRDQNCILALCEMTGRQIEIYYPGEGFTQPLLMGDEALAEKIKLQHINKDRDGPLNKFEPLFSENLSIPIPNTSGKRPRVSAFHNLEQGMSHKAAALQIINSGSLSQQLAAYGSHPRAKDQGWMYESGLNGPWICTYLYPAILAYRHWSWNLDGPHSQGIEHDSWSKKKKAIILQKEVTGPWSPSRDDILKDMDFDRLNRTKVLLGWVEGQEHISTGFSVSQTTNNLTKGPIVLTASPCLCTLDLDYEDLNILAETLSTPQTHLIVQPAIFPL
eukprot:2147386-Rhodomonas_salina.1